MYELSEWGGVLAESPWVLAALFLTTMIDGFFPPIPSETLVIALAALALTTGGPQLWMIAGVAAAGAFTGDQIAYSIGRRVPVRRLCFLQSARARTALARAEAALARRGASFIICARFVPVGRVAVNITAGAVAFPRRRFTAFAGIAAITWSAYSVVIGAGAGRLLDGQHPLLSVAVGIVGGLVTGMAVDVVLQRLLAGRQRRRDSGARRRGYVTALRVLLAVAFFGLIAVQVLVIPAEQGRWVPATLERAAMGWTMIVLPAGALIAVQLVIICTNKLLTMVEEDRIFSEGATTWVNTIVAATAAAWVLVLVLVIVFTLHGIPERAFALASILVAGAVVGLLMIVMRALLRQATDLRTSMEALI